MNNKIKLAVIGSRNISNYELVKSEFLKNFLPADISLIISGNAIGVDRDGERLAKEFDIPTLIFPAKWDDFSEPCIIKVNKFGKKYNSLAGFNRNKDIIDAADQVIAFHKENSRGTADSISIAEKQGKRVIVIKV